MSDLNQGKFAVNQSDKQPLPTTIASAATIAPTQRLTFVTGTVQVATISPPLSGYHDILLCFTDNAPGALLTSGNIKTAYTPITNRPFRLSYDPSSAKWWVQSVV